MRETPKPDWRRAADRCNSWGPETSQRIFWGAVTLVAVALVWPLLAPRDTAAPTANNPQIMNEVARAPSAAVGPGPDCALADRPQEPPPAGLAAVSTSVVGQNAIVESIRWARTTREGLWGVAAVAECGAVRLDAVWTEPTGQRRRHNVSHTGRAVIGVVADGVDGALSVYTVRGTTEGAISAMLHISTDRGVTWQERAVPPSAEPHVRAGVLPGDWTEWSVAS